MNMTGWQFWVPLVLALAVGAAECFWGFQLQKLLIGMTGFFIGLLAGMEAAKALGMPAWAPFALGIVMGVVLAMLAFKLYLLGIFALCAVAVSACAYAFVQQPRWLMLLIGVGGGIVLGVLAVKFTRPVLIFVTAIGGGFSCAQTLRAIPAVALALGETGTFWVFGLLGAALAVCGMVYQAKHTRAG